MYSNACVEERIKFSGPGLSGSLLGLAKSTEVLEWVRRSLQNNVSGGFSEPDKSSGFWNPENFMRSSSRAWNHPCTVHTAHVDMHIAHVHMDIDIDTGIDIA